MLNSTHKKEQKHKNGGKDGKVLYKLMNNGKSIQNSNGKFLKQNQCKTCKQQKRLFKMDIQTKLYVMQNI